MGEKEYYEDGVAYDWNTIKYATYEFRKALRDFNKDDKLNIKKNKMKINEEKVISIGDFFELSKKEGGTYEIETPQGWVEIGDLVKKPNKECYALLTNDYKEIRGSNDHYVETKRGWVKLEDIDVQNDIVFTYDGEDEIISLESIGVHNTYDLEVLSDEHKYYANGIVSHNTGKTTIGNIICNKVYDTTVIWITPEILSENNYKALSSIKALYKLADFLSPCIIILEDLDLFSQDRDRGGDAMSLGALMNILDGVNSVGDAVTIGTTNRLETIERALRNGPGRFDRIIEIPALTDNLRCKMFKERLKEWSIKKEVLTNLISQTQEWTGAEVQEFVNSLNLKLISINKNKKNPRKKVLTIEWVKEIIETMSKFGIGEVSSGFGFNKIKS